MAEPTQDNLERRIQELEKKPLNLGRGFSGNPIIFRGLILLAVVLLFVPDTMGVKFPTIILLLLIALAYWWWHERRTDWWTKLRTPKSHTRPAKAPTRPPTPEDTTQAQRSMKVARSHIQDYWDITEKLGKKKEFSPELQLHYLQAATKSLQKTYSLDPNATITVAQDDFSVTYTHDTIAAEILYLEALSYRYGALNRHNEAYEYGFKGSVNNRIKRDADAMYLKGLQAALKAVQFAPYHAGYLTELARLYNQTGYEQLARETIEKALKIDPDHMEALKLSEQIS